MLSLNKVSEVQILHTYARKNYATLEIKSNSVIPVLPQARRIHTGFHRFTEIGQIFPNKYIFININISKFKFKKWRGVALLQIHYNYNMEIDLDKIIRRFARRMTNWQMTNDQYPVCMTQKPRKEQFKELKSEKFRGGTCPRTFLEALSSFV